jgi:hypothetical protein
MTDTVVDMKLDLTRKTALERKALLQAHPLIGPALRKMEEAEVLEQAAFQAAFAAKKARREAEREYFRTRDTYADCRLDYAYFDAQEAEADHA